ncbi:hypothetical protein PAPYR_8580 [Paratrimastix pyriformis]|uniref:Uncharacterized protein n=1 Tax=Paratrimastix pyriformis TaxID=342808 RepID=A0ABQ8UAE2_9EUKA|nr:hypothetical protein PAPYR_8580 [Paratrimastix pyriformis]
MFSDDERPLRRWCSGTRRRIYRFRKLILLLVTIFAIVAAFWSASSYSSSTIPRIHFIFPTIPRDRLPNGTEHPLSRTIASFLNEFRDNPSLFPFDLWVYNMRPNNHPAFTKAREQFHAEEDSGLIRFFEINATLISPTLATALAPFLQCEECTTPSPVKIQQTLDFGAMLTHFYSNSSYSTAPGAYRWSPQNDGELFFLMEDDFFFCPDSRLHLARLLEPLLPAPSPLQPQHPNPAGPTASAAGGNIPNVAPPRTLFFSPGASASPAEALFSFLDRFSAFRLSFGLNGILAQHRDIPFFLSVVGDMAGHWPVDTIFTRVWQAAEERSVEHFGARTFFTYRYNQVHGAPGGTISTMNNDFPDVFQCHDPLIGMWTDDRYLPECARLSDLSPCADPLARTTSLFWGPRRDILDRVISTPLSDDLPQETVWVPNKNGSLPDVAVTRFHMGASRRGESCRHYCLRAHHHQSVCRPDLLDQVNSCADLERYFRCAGCEPHPYSSWMHQFPGRVKSGKCFYSFIPSYLSCDATNWETERLCACEVSDVRFDDDDGPTVI